MVYRRQHILLSIYRPFKCAFLFSAAFLSVNCFSAEEVNNDFFEVGVFSGFLNIQDFNSELATGVQASFNASEDFFLQFNYLQADASQSSFEKSQGQLFSGSDRQFSHYDFLLGYNLFQAEFFGSSQKAAISAMYLVAGAGETEFGGEANFTFTIGAGYQFALNKKYVLRFDYRDHIYKSSLLEEDSNTHNTQITAGIGYLF